MERIVSWMDVMPGEMCLVFFAHVVIDNKDRENEVMLVCKTRSGTAFCEDGKLRRVPSFTTVRCY